MTIGGCVLIESALLSDIPRKIVLLILLHLLYLSLLFSRFRGFVPNTSFTSRFSCYIFLFCPFSVLICFCTAVVLCLSFCAGNVGGTCGVKSAR